ncbi:hypothetical protein E1293_37225 [Actinomadura darangshiensis]|uniref:DUF4232 domain-containing protein n=1 Tax=Actinomadura darangshiensis TaxID=705336 RepID=A0A4R5A7U3_9ACTN|nr:hypothetical protein [Actinomadura darangshiensis]TDD68248.1 hypothetical protein E1293_37225 [Actinomadura darangshiensis]
MALASVLGAVGLLAWTCSAGGDEGEPVRDAGAVDSASPAPPPSAMPTVTVTTTTTPTAEPADGGPCDDKDLVVNMSAAENTFAGAERPEFRVTVVSIGKGSCTFDTGTLDVRITSGSDRIWSSAECRKGGAPKETLKRGIPYVDNVTWDRERGCKGATPARPGTYVATLKGKKVEKQIFRLR